MAFNVVAVDIYDDKFDLAKELGADKTVNSAKEDPVQFMKDEVGGVQASVSVAVSKKPFEQAYYALKRGRTLVAVALPNDNMEIPIFNTVLDGKTIKGSIVGTRTISSAFRFFKDLPNVFSEPECRTSNPKYAASY